MLICRLATETDLPVLSLLMARAIDVLQADVLSPAEIAASRAVMGLDTRLVADRTYFVAEIDGVPAGCGGWSFRATLYGGDHSHDLRDDARLDPVTDAARVRAMYTSPDFARRGVGRAILAACEEAATAAGYSRVELMATLAGERLYSNCGYRIVEPAFAPPVNGVVVPLFRMEKDLQS